MKNYTVQSIFLIFMVLIISECKSPSEPDEKKENAEKEVTLNGQVLNKTTNNPIDSAVVRVPTISSETVKITDSNGEYSLKFNADSTKNIEVVAFKESYLLDTTTVLAVPGRTVNVPALYLEPTSKTKSTSGKAASIILFSQSTKSISVRESGAPETAKITFEVQDSSGIPINLGNMVEVNFSIGSSLGGGEYITPPSATTSNSGKVSVYISSGTIAGAIQIIAKIEVDNKTILSHPIPIAIHGGLPDDIHFSLAAHKINFPGYKIFGLTNIITAFVGDKYANPVKPGTAVYFTSTGGIIEGSALTGEKGQGSVTLYSAEPRPIHNILGAGFATITGSTVDENNQTITDDIIVLFSGSPFLAIEPYPTFTIENASSQFFTYTVSDQNGNPMAEGTTINVTVEGKNVEAKGDMSINLPDTQSRGRGAVEFGFSIFDTVPDSIDVQPVGVKVTTIGPNGAASLSIVGITN